MEDDQKILYQMSEQEYQNLQLELGQNKKEMFKILKNNPKIGVYLNEKQEDWHIFYQFYINFLKSQIGPRGECAKLIRSELLKQEQTINQVLLPFSQTATTHIREIYMKHKFFIPCKEYSEYLKFDEANQKNKGNFSRLKDENSPMYKSIKEGLINKHGIQFNFQAQFKRLQENYELKIQESEKEIARLKVIMQQTKSYHDYLRVKEVMAPYFRMWIEADSGMGKENVKTGQLFQERVNKIMIPFLLRREREDKNWIAHDKQIQIFINLSWIPKNLGQIDIAFGYKDPIQNRYFIFTLIECKSRLFDLRQAYKQVSLDDQQPLNKGPTFSQLKELKRLKKLKSCTKKDKKKNSPVEQNENEQKFEKQDKNYNSEDSVVTNKKFLSSKYGPVELVPNHHYYIVTTLPHNDFVLPIESKLKEGIEKHTKNLFTEDIKSQPLYLALKQRFQCTKSPLDWVTQYESNFGNGSSNILVMH